MLDKISDKVLGAISQKFGNIVSPPTIKYPLGDGNPLPMRRLLTSPVPLKRLSVSSRDRSQAHAGIKATAFLTKAVDAGRVRLDRLLNGCRGASERTAFSPSGDFATGRAVRQPRRKPVDVETGSGRTKRHPCEGGRLSCCPAASANGSAFQVVFIDSLMDGLMVSPMVDVLDNPLLHKKVNHTANHIFTSELN